MKRCKFLLWFSLGMLGGAGIVLGVQEFARKNRAKRAQYYTTYGHEVVEMGRQADVILLPAHGAADHILAGWLIGDGTVRYQEFVVDLEHAPQPVSLASPPEHFASSVGLSSVGKVKCEVHPLTNGPGWGHAVALSPFEWETLIEELKTKGEKSM
jgi:hypothetical protein